MVSGLQKCLLTSVNIAITILYIEIHFSEKGSVVFTILSTAYIAQKRLRTFALRSFVVSLSLSNKIPG